MPETTMKAMTEYNRWLIDYAGSKGVRVLDLSVLGILGPEDKRSHSMDPTYKRGSGGLHPNELGYIAIANMASNYLPKPITR